MVEAGRGPLWAKNVPLSAEVKEFEEDFKNLEQTHLRQHFQLSKRANAADGCDSAVDQGGGANAGTKRPKDKSEPKAG